MKFNYKAQKVSGEFYEAEREAADKYALARELKAGGETLVSAYAEGEQGRFLDLERLKEVFSRIGIHDKIVFSRSLGNMVGAGLSVSRALSVLERQARNEKLRRTIAELSGRIMKGETLSQSLTAFPAVFSTLFIAMVRAGEEGGKLSEALLAVAEELDRSYLLQRKVKGALIYPAIIVTAMLAIGILLFIYVVPELTATFKEFQVELPLSTRIVIASSDFLSAHTILGLSIVTALIGGAYLAVRSQRGKLFFDALMLRLPVISPVIKEANAARTGQALASLLSSGVEVVSALLITAEVLSNSHYKEALRQAREAVVKGEPMSNVFRAHAELYPLSLSEMMAVGEETGKLAPMLREIGIFFEGEVDQKTKDLSTVIEPVLMVIVGVAVGFFSLAMIAPMYSLMNSI